LTITFKNQTLQLHPTKAIYWREQDILLIADLHLGKAAHFRKKGLAAPATVLQKNLSNLASLLKEFTPHRVLFLGDLFHSSLNKVWEQFSLFLENYPTISFELVQGNHDILPPQFYENAQLEVYTEPLVIDSFIFSHYPLKFVPDNLYNFYGHLHPGVVLSGFGGHEIKLACFHFGQTQCVLPAFGAFTGLFILQPKVGDRVFVIAEETVIEV